MFLKVKIGWSVWNGSKLTSVQLSNQCRVQVPSHSPHLSPALSPHTPSTMSTTNHLTDSPVKAEVKVEPGSEPGALVESSTMQAILAFLKKNNLKGTEEALKAELVKAQVK